MRHLFLACLAASVFTAGLASAQVSSGQALPASDSVLAAQRISGPTPVYPADAKAAGIQGTVVISLEVTKTGAVQNPRVMSGPTPLRVAAMEAVSQWMYKPYLSNGQPAEVTSTVSINFVLTETTIGDGPAGPVDPYEAKAQRTNVATVGGIGGETASVGAAPAGRTGQTRVSAGLMAGLLIQKVNPVYPKEAKKAHLGGLVLMHAIITKTGDISDLTVISGPDLLRDSALTAVRQWKYKPLP